MAKGMFGTSESKGYGFKFQRSKYISRQSKEGLSTQSF
jgi:hypothetical protein